MNIVAYNTDFCLF